jgi:hypothetical protein
MKSLPKTGLTALALAALIAAAPAWAAEPDAYLPANAELVLVINVRQILDSPVVKKYGLEEMKKAIAKEEKAQAFIKATGVDPLKDIDSILVANSGGVEKGQTEIVVRGTFNPEKINTALQEFAKKEADKISIPPKEDGVQVYEFKPEKKGDKPLFAAFADNKTVVATQSKEDTIKAVKNGGKKAPMPTPKLKAALSKVTGKESLWAVGVITDQAKADMKKNPPTAALAEKLDMITGSVDLTDAAQANLQIHATDAEGAKQIKAMITQLVNIFKLSLQDNPDVPGAATELLGNLKVTADQSTVNIGLKLTPEMIEKLNKEGKKDKADKDK